MTTTTTRHEHAVELRGFMALTWAAELAEFEELHEQNDEAQSIAVLIPALAEQTFAGWQFMRIAEGSTLQVIRVVMQSRSTGEVRDRWIYLT